MTSFSTFATLLCLSLFVLLVSSAPLNTKEDTPDPVASTSSRSKGSSRSARYLGSSWFDFLTPGGFQEQILPRAAEEDTSSNNQPDSPIYYIRLPANPYVYMPGMGYVSRPAPVQTPVASPPPVIPPPVRRPSPFYQLPLDFVSNGKPGSTVQIWPRDPVPTTTTTTTTTPPPRPPPVIKPFNPTNINRLPGPFFFNGKPSGFYILQQDPYNSLYADVLHNFYP
ncbi:uncharacterized protein LOC132196948 [Neocloeon triangulifer]|uniref:uncharacterized protein LOC132196948 n=1 Tax=Neocloeon triangulifer TaxID=2078957 RepID=UPI00286F2BB6|nr:uncharacterized protein LOC132196948 [Neocloeon triangulifer]XP_059475900.1 uncharacterized protein LOC132196948 [Neocloeon triangulifer]